MSYQYSWKISKDCGIVLPFNKNSLKAAVDQVGYKRTVVPTDCLNALAVHLVVFIGFCEVETGVALLIDQQVGEVDLRGKNATVVRESKGLPLLTSPRRFLITV